MATISAFDDSDGFLFDVTKKLLQSESYKNYDAEQRKKVDEELTKIWKRNKDIGDYLMGDE